MNEQKRPYQPDDSDAAPVEEAHTRAASDAWKCLRADCSLTADEHDLEMVMEHTFDLQEGAADGLTERVADRLGIDLNEGNEHG